MYFDSDFYYLKYPDLKDINKVELIKHYLNYGIHENRYPCNMYIYNWDKYKNDNEDLKDFNKEELIRHYLNYGVHEKREITYLFNLSYNLKSYDWDQYKNDNEDLKDMNEEELIEHYLNHGFFEQRKITTLSNILPNVLCKKIEFEIDTYRLYNSYINHLPLYQTMRHFIYHGSKENRIFTSVIPEFDIKYYKTYEDLKHLNNNELWAHYLYYGINEERCINNKNEILSKDLNNISDIIKSVSDNLIHTKEYTTAVIYVYYNRKNEYKNETNLAFFINETIKKRKEYNDSVEFLFIINNNFTEVNIPKESNVNILYNNNCMDFEAYLIGIKYLESKYETSIIYLYENVLFMNCSCTGPFVESNKYWLNSFYKKLDDTKSVCCSPILTYLPLTSTASIPGYCFMVKTKHMYLLIKPHKFTFRNYSNTVLGKKKDKLDCIISGEHAVSVVFLKNNLNICSLCNSNINYRNKSVAKNHLKFSGDRYPLHNYSLYTTVFIKNNWRRNGNNERDSLPVQWIQTKKLIENFSNFQYFNYTDLNYKNLNISQTGTIVLNNKIWNSKEDFGKLFADSEELIVFPNINSNNGQIVYYHSNNENFIKRYCIEGIKSLMSLGYYIIFYTKSKFIKNVNFPFTINLTDNTLEEIIEKHYELIVLDDSYIFPCTEVNILQSELISKNYKHAIKKINNIFDLYITLTPNNDKNLGKLDIHFTKDNKYLNFLKFYL